MKNGDTVKVQRVGSHIIGSGQVVMVSQNQRSLILAGDDLPSFPGVLTVHHALGRVLMLLRDSDNGCWSDLLTGMHYEVIEAL